MNILLINHYAGSTHYGMEYRPYYLAKEWLKKGHSVMILAASYSHIRTQQPDMKGCSKRDENIEGIHYRWYKTNQHKGNGLGRVRNILNFLKGVYSDTNDLVTKFNPDVVIASSTYPMDIWVARKIAKKANAKLIYEVHDLWPLSPIELGGMSRWHPFIIWCQRAENYAYQHADEVVSMLPKTLPHMTAQGLDAKKFHYIPNGVNPDEWENRAELPKQFASKLKRIKQKGLPLVGYAGTHGLANALDLLIDAAKQSEGLFEVVLVGTGPDKLALENRVKNEGIRNVTLLPAIPKISIPAFLKQIDIAYIGLLPQPLFRFGISPNKLMDYMMSATPIVMAINAGNDLVNDAQCGISVPPKNSEKVRGAILKLSSLPYKERVLMGEKGRQFIYSHQTYPVLAKSFLAIMKNNLEIKG